MLRRQAFSRKSAKVQFIDAMVILGNRSVMPKDGCAELAPQRGQVFWRRGKRCWQVRHFIESV